MRRRKVLLISPDKIYKKITGPSIRYLNFAIELSKELDVVLYIPNKDSDFDFTHYDFSIIQGNKKELRTKALTCDSLVIQGIALKAYPFLKKIKKPLVVDLYDPIVLENLELRKNLSVTDRVKYHESDLHLILEQLSIGDYFICASEDQKAYWMGMLSAINRVNPITYLEESNMKNLIDVVPFGLNNVEAVKEKNIIKGVWKGIELEDKVLIWGGGIWNWFDPFTLIESMNIICKQRKDIKLFFMGIGHPNAQTDTTTAEQCIDLSKKYDLYNKNIFFNDWVEYEKRHHYLLDADIGVSTYFNNLETRFSFRTRILDYFWCGLPSILTKGDYMAKLVETEQLGVCCDEKNPLELSRAIVNLVDDEEMIKKIKKNINKIKKQYMWENVVGPLNSYCKDPYISSDKKMKVKIFYKINSVSIIKYYLIRVKSKVVKILRKGHNEK